MKTTAALFGLLLVAGCASDVTLPPVEPMESPELSCARSPRRTADPVVPIRERRHRVGLNELPAPTADLTPETGRKPQIVR